MLISICIPQYNRSRFLLVVLESIVKQDYSNIEVIISDDCSTDDSQYMIPKYIAEQENKCSVRFRYIRQEQNIGYDRNLRASMGAAEGDYLFILSNDDALPRNDTISNLVTILKQLSFPDVAFANLHPYGRESEVARRAQKTALIGSGPYVALKTFRSFCGVCGLIMKRSAFRKHDTSEYDGSIYVQIYLAAHIISSGGTLASISESLVAADVQIQGKKANSYLDVLAYDNRKFKRKTGGLDQEDATALEFVQQ